jgi:predicted RNase H-like HicB family nuclease
MLSRLKIFLLLVFLNAVLGAEQFIFVPLWGSDLDGVAQWKISSVPLAIEQLDLPYNISETSMEYLRQGYAVYDMELRLTRLRENFAPQKIEFLVQLYDQRGRPLLEKDYEDNLYVVERPDFSTFNTARITLPGFVLERAPARIKIWLKSYVDQDGKVKEISKPKKRRKDKDTTVIIIKQ